ncbi:hypothetical protein Tco_1019779 [Tanacetum coccineum]|uniref:Uncharacterized protein n=1 Tax=Tanacetum coccineum TaxID=301880 RepID=A0ABQ5FZT5_9ASTR
MKKAIQSHNAECKEEAQAEKQEYIDLIDMSVRTILREEVKTQLPHILPKVVSDFATPSTYEVAASLLEFKLTTILIDKIEKNKSYDKGDYKRELYDALVKPYQTDKDLFDAYGESAHTEEPSHTVDDSEDQHNQEFDMDYTDDQPDIEAALKCAWFKKLEQPPTPDLDWN